MGKKRNIIYIVLFFMIIFFNGLIILFKDDKRISEYENRQLTLMPSFTFETVKSGEFFKLYDKYISDQIFDKEFWQEQYIKLNLDILNKHRINNYVKTDDNKLLVYNSYTTEDRDALKESIYNAVSYIKDAEKIVNDNGGKLYFITAPVQSSMFLKDYPKYFNPAEDHYAFQRKTILEACEKYNINYTTMYKVLSNYDPSSVYHTTELHYNFLGAYYTYQQIMKTLVKDKDLKFDTNTAKYEDFQVEEKEFKGAYNRQLLYLINDNDKLLVPKINTDKWEVYNNRVRVPYVINQNSPFYSAFMGGEMSETLMRTNKPQYDNALIIGDSFTDPVEPLIAINFNETRSLDFRMREVPVEFQKYIENYKPKVVLVIINEETIRDDNPNIKMKQ